ncbi:hypothetical protein [Micrococcus sp.]|uniref:hypothetical protein n=1 Tax=Micrococcus sp. TaxID=1271 RepID=UPI002A90BFB1|nr:hypothetical protein [Micrococcus sp.]MDY6054446.1 hypothetical protein [Micrococcus sp.]
MIGIVLLSIAATELTVALLAGRGPGLAPSARHRLIGLGVGAAVTLVALLLAGTPSASADPAPFLLAASMALVLTSAWTAAGTRPWASPVLLPVLAVLTGLELAAYGTLDQALGTGWPVLAGTLAFLIEPANRISRDVLELAGRRDERLQAAERTRTERTPADPTPAEPGSVDSATDPAAGLKGGRYIGPVERILMTGLGLAAAYPVVAALMAAKGIVRFPEINADAGHGSRAEEFLVGSLTSWSLAFLAVLLLTLTAPVRL